VERSASPIKPPKKTLTSWMNDEFNVKDLQGKFGWQLDNPVRVSMLTGGSLSGKLRREF
jgi:hypothetical protein